MIKIFPAHKQNKGTAKINIPKNLKPDFFYHKDATFNRVGKLSQSNTNPSYSKKNNPPEMFHDKTINSILSNDTNYSTYGRFN